MPLQNFLLNYSPPYAFQNNFVFPSKVKMRKVSIIFFSCTGEKILKAEKAAALKSNGRNSEKNICH